MVKVREDLTGKSFGRLTVICQTNDFVSTNNRHEPTWLCQCNCGNKNLITVLGKNLKNQKTQSCGCIRKETTINYNATNKKQYNTYCLDGECGIGYCHNTNTPFYFDLEDYDKIKDYCWYEHIHPNGYHALVTKDGVTGSIIKMVYLIAGTHQDHIDRNPLNNQKTNLRPATPQENASNTSLHKNNTSGITGVYWSKTRQLWIAQIGYKRKCITLGSFVNKEDAIVARLKAEQKYFKDFAPQKHLFEKYNIQ